MGEDFEDEGLELPDKEQSSRQSPRSYDSVAYRVLGVLAIGILVWAVAVTLFLKVSHWDIMLTILWSAVLFLVFAGSLLLMMGFKSQNVKPLSRRQLKKATEPPLIEPSPLTRKLTSLRSDQLAEVYYDSDRHWVVTLFMVINPRINRYIDKDLPVWPKLKPWFILHLVILAGTAIASGVLLDKNPGVAVGIITCYLIAYMAWCMWMVNLNRRRRLIATKVALERFSYQLPFTPSDGQTIPSLAVTQFPKAQTLMGKLLGYHHGRINTIETNETFGENLRFLRDYARLELALTYVTELHQSAEARKLEVDQLDPMHPQQSPTYQWPTAPTRRTRNMGGRPPR